MPSNIPRRTHGSMWRSSSNQERPSWLFTMKGRCFLKPNRKAFLSRFIAALKRSPLPPLDGGWGWRYSIRNGRAFNISGNKGLQIIFKDGKKLLLEANAFVHHSITASNGDAEGLPNAIIEAMAMELPVISTWHAGIPELIEDGVNGYLVKEKDVDTYVKRMKDILEWKYQPKNREKIVSHFSNEVHCQSLIKIYNKYL